MASASKSRISELRKDLVTACRVLYATGAAGDGLAGHLSARLDNDSILIKPRSVSWTKLQPQDLIVIGFDGARKDAPEEPSGVREWPIHACIYAARADVHCVLHAHPVNSTLLAALGISVEPLDQDCASFADRLPILDNGAVSIATPTLGNEVVEALGRSEALLLKNHGSVIAGCDIAEVCVTAHKLEKVAQALLRANGLAQRPFMTAEKRSAILAARKGVESSAMIRERWRMLQDYYLGCADG